MSSVTKLVGILNVTPDSFSDGGRITDAGSALDALRQLIDDGADVIDIGAESTRPNAKPLNAKQEWERLEHILPEAINLAHASGRLISLDTRHAATAQQAIALGVDWVNDVGGLRDPAMLDAVRESQCKLVMMHALSVPVKPDETLSAKADAVATVIEWAISRQQALQSEGINPRRVIFDPGIGFGKTAPQSLDLVLRARTLETVGFEILIGHSRKSFLSLFTGAPAAERDDVTLALSSHLMKMQVDYLRVHDVKRHRALLRVLND